ncbi:uncharacterized protein TNCV_254381 [Trichonephila clavipes]|nr:uncharacterized protein TNCV_254381 [Trichonephila clavipes]
MNGAVSWDPFGLAYVVFTGILDNGAIGGRIPIFDDIPLLQMTKFQKERFIDGQWLYNDEESERAAKIEQEKFKLESEKAKIEFEKIKLEQLKKELELTNAKNVNCPLRKRKQRELQLSRDEEKNFPLAAPVPKRKLIWTTFFAGAASLMEAKARKPTFSILKRENGVSQGVVVIPELASNILRNFMARLFDPLGLLGPVAGPNLHARVFGVLKSTGSTSCLLRGQEWHHLERDFNSVSMCIGRCGVHPQATRVGLYGPLMLAREIFANGDILPFSIAE